MTDRIDDLIQRLMERDFEVEGVPCITLTNAIRKIRQWAGEQKPVSDNGLRSAVERIAYRNGNLYGADVRSDLRDILNRTSSPAKLDPDTGAALAGIKELHAEFGPTNYDDPATTPYPVAGEQAVIDHEAALGDAMVKHYSQPVALSNLPDGVADICPDPSAHQPVAGDVREKVAKWFSREHAHDPENPHGDPPRPCVECYKMADSLIAGCGLAPRVHWIRPRHRATKGAIMTDLKKRLEELCDEADSAEGNDKGWIDTDVIRCALLASSPVVDAEAVRRAVLDQYIDVTTESMLTSNGLGAQLLDEKWYVPKWGCDTLDHMLAALLSPTQEDGIPVEALHDPTAEEFYTLEEMTREVPAVPALGLGPMIQHGNMAHEKGQPCAICAVIAQHHEKELK